jgi:hypothetical protein
MGAMGYRFTRGWSRASVVVGAGVFVLALLLASWLGFSNDAEFERFSLAVRILAFLVVSLAGLVVGGTMVVAGQLVSVVLDQRDLLARIYEVLTAKAGASAEATSRRTAISVTIALLGAAALLGGCATGRIAWHKPRVTQTEKERDENACLRAAIGTDGGGQLLAPYCIDREVYTRCMETRGYAVRSK